MSAKRKKASRESRGTRGFDHVIEERRKKKKKRSHCVFLKKNVFNELVEFNSRQKQDCRLYSRL